MNIHIHKPLGEFPDDWSYAAYKGFKDKGFKVVDFEEIEEVPANKQSLVVACIEETIKFFERLKVEVPDPLNIPYSIKDFAKRKIEIKTLGEFKKETELPIFVKPYSKLKEIPAGVITKKSSRELLFQGFNEETLVMTSNVIEMVTEYRCFVLKGELVGVKYYIGDFEKFIDCNIVKDAIKQYTDAPIAYTIDFALTDKNETVLIECNDAWAIGNYGLDGSVYSKMLYERWVEMIK